MDFAFSDVERTRSTDKNLSIGFVPIPYELKIIIR